MSELISCDMEIASDEILCTQEMSFLIGLGIILVNNELNRANAIIFIILMLKCGHLNPKMSHNFCS